MIAATTRMPVIYEITASVGAGLSDAYERYMLEKHIPDVMATSTFASATFARADVGRYRIWYEAESRDLLVNYLEEHAPRLRAEMMRLFPEGVEHVREEWTVAADFASVGNS